MMMSLLPVVSLLVVIVISLLVVRVATVALVHTGLSTQLARFQARSAFTGSGFTTAESEKVTQHPVRRRIIMLLMLLGNAGLVTAISSLMLSFLNTSEKSTVSPAMRIAILGVGVAVLWTIANSRWIDQQMTTAIDWTLQRWTDLDVRDYSGLLHLSKGYSVVEMAVQADDWMAQRKLAELRLAEEGVLVLGVQRADGVFLGVPRGNTLLTVGDVVIIYGPNQGLADLNNRQAGSRGNWDHHVAVDRQRRTEIAEQQEDNTS